MRIASMPQLQHPDAVLRAIDADDIQAWFDYLTKPEVFEHTSWNVSSPSELQHYAWRPEDFSDDSMLRFAVACRQTNRLIGTAGFHTVSSRNRSAELAYDLSPLVWGKGIASAACACLTEWAHVQAGVLRVQATTLQSNTRSRKVLERCGFECEGLLKSFRMVRGAPGDFWMFSHVAASEVSASTQA